MSKFPKMVCSTCGRLFMNDEQAAYYEKVQDDLVQIYSKGTVGESGGKAIRGYLMKGSVERKQ